MTTKWKNRGAVQKGFKLKFRRDMKAAGIYAAREMERVVQASGRKGKSGDMLAAPIESNLKITASQYRVSWGWPLNVQQAHRDRMTRPGQSSAGGFKPSLSYFELQDHGFLHRNGNPVEGMHAAEAGEKVFKETMRDRGWK